MYQVSCRSVLLLSLLVHSGCSERQRPIAATTSRHEIDADWPDFLGPDRNGKSSEVGLPTTWPAGGPPVVWQKKIGTGYSAPVISHGRLFHFARFGDTARLTCLNSQTGDELWTCDYPTDYTDMLGYNNGPRATPVVDGSQVYTFGVEGMLQAVRTSDGQRIWQIDTMKDFNVVKNFFGVGSTPLVWGELLIVNIGGSPQGGPPDVYSANGKVRSDASAVVALEKTTGKVRWKTGEDLASYASPIASKIDGTDVLFVFARSGLMAIDPVKGQSLRAVSIAREVAGKCKCIDARRSWQRGLYLRDLRAWQCIGPLY